MSESLVRECHRDCAAPAHDLRLSILLQDHLREAPKGASESNLLSGLLPTEVTVPGPHWHLRFEVHGALRHDSEHGYSVSMKWLSSQRSCCRLPTPCQCCARPLAAKALVG
jgi:hypothetical protein